MKRKIISIFLLFIILFGNISIFANNEVEEEFSEIWVFEAKNELTDDIPKIQSRYAVGIDRESKKILFSKEENKKVPMASTTKIMTAIILIENGDLNKTIEVCKKSANTGGSRLGLKEGDKITLNDLLYGLMLCSGNDAAVQIAMEIGDSIEKFADLMNKKARMLKLENTNFVTPHGLDEDKHYTTAYELAIITDYALAIDKFAQIVNTKTYTVTINGYSKTINNTNELLGYLEGVNGVKTGFTNGAGRCLVTSISRDNFNIIVVVLGADTKKIRTKDSIKIIEYCYKNYKIIDLMELIQEKYSLWLNINQKRIKIEKGVKNLVDLEIEQIPYTKYPITDFACINVEIEAQLNLKAPVEPNETVGSIIVKENEEEVFKVNILINERVEKKTIFNYFCEILELNSTL